MNPQTTIAKINGAQRGSFAEYLFGISVPNAVRYNREGRDFDIDGVRVDVKSSLRLSELMPSVLKRVGARSHGQEYANVIFYKDKVSVHYDDSSIHVYTWEEIESTLSEWVSKTKKTFRTTSNISFEEEYDDIKQTISAVLSRGGYQTKTIYRTGTTRFGLGESPGNLLPNLIKANRVRVYVDFNDSQRTCDNIRFIIAFPENSHRDIPRLTRVRLKSGTSDEKIDLIAVSQTKHRCYFGSIDELTRCFFERYP